MRKRCLAEIEAIEELKDLEKDTVDEHVDGILNAWVYHVTVAD